MKKQAWLILCIIAFVAGLALAATNMVTAGPIEEQRVKAIQAARVAVFPTADDFREMAMEEDTVLDDMLEAISGSDIIGYVLQITVSGYGGPIEIIMGVDTQGMITGLSVGGSKFAETAGLGTQVKEPAFTDQFVGLSETPTLNGNVDTISGATISSSAVINGVIKCYQQYGAIAGMDSSAAAKQYQDGVYTGEADGYNGAVKVSVTIAGGLITQIDVIESHDSQEILSKLETGLLPSVVQNNTTDGVNAVSGATSSSQSMLEAIADALNQAAAG